MNAAIILRQVEIVRLLIEKGADVNHLTTYSRHKPLRYALDLNKVKYPEAEEIVKVLLDAGAEDDPEKKPSEPKS